MNKYLITAALPYANGPLHLGHLAGAYLPSDIYARFLRLQGKKVALICGSDEHGAAISIRAKKENRTPQEIIDVYHNLNKDTFKKFGISFDIYHRTSEKLHHETASEFFKELKSKNQFLEIDTDQLYDEKFQQFLADRFVIGECPHCSKQAYGDQCESCGRDLSPTELINPKSTLSGETPILKKTKHWFFRLEEHQQWLEEWINSGTIDGELHHHSNSWRDHVKGQCQSWFNDGLKPRAITRDLDWGIPVPVDTDEAKGKVLYVWFDAPIGYISATKQWASDNNENWEDWWKNEDTTLVQFIGKDNIVFHCAIFPSLLKAHGGYVLPKNVPANQFLNFEGKKFSKSNSWGIEQHEYLEIFADFPNKEDALRYYLTKIAPEQKDSDFKWDEFVDAHDNELVANLGNFFNRVISLTNNYYGGIVPTFNPNILIKNSNGELQSVGDLLNSEVNPLLDSIEKKIDAYEFRAALKTVLEISSIGNTVLQNNAPWSLYKTNPNADEIGATLYCAIQICSILGTIVQPFLPFTSDKIQGLLNLNKVENGDWNKLRGFDLVPSGHQLSKPELLFTKIKGSVYVDIVAAQKRKLFGE